MADSTCGRKFSGNLSPTLRRPGCRNPEFLANLNLRPRSPPKTLVLELPGPHSRWGHPTLTEKRPIVPSSTKDDELEKLLEKKPSVPKIGPPIYQLPKGQTNPKGWWSTYEPQLFNLDFVTSNSEYSRYPPNPYTMPISYSVKDRNFTKTMTEFPYYRNRSLNVN